MNRKHVLILSTAFSAVLLIALLVPSCSKQPDLEQSASDIIGAWFNEGTGDHDDVVQTILTIKDDGTMTINAFSSIDKPEDSDNIIPAVWKAEGDNLIMGFAGIEDEDGMDEHDYESCKFKVENDCLLLCADDIWYLFSKLK